MKTLLLSLAIAFGLISSTAAQQVVEVPGSQSVAETVSSLKAEIEKMDLTLMQEINHRENAEKADLELGPVHVLVFGNPKVGTQLMQEDPMIGLELPLRIVVFERDGETRMAYRDPRKLWDSYEIGDQAPVLAKMNSMLRKLTNLAGQAAE